MRADGRQEGNGRDALSCFGMTETQTRSTQDEDVILAQ